MPRRRRIAAAQALRELAAHPRWSLRRLEIDGSIAREPSSELDDAGINKTVFKKRYDRKPKAIAEGVEPEQ